ncbi:DNA helicase [Prolixibacter bellariivorans]|uniref:DNA helicase n=1 Tax=Prolixibacter bellariivorans TaxID=314319 RepID=A0A5M4B5Y8_9BACT|nr:AAA domain-containing protein [Prolixibacter bellariivorans]GET35248.1 DNA helicase [Prolixibacter bellariivorans]
MSTINNWTTYWRNTLADGARNEITLSSLDRNTVIRPRPDHINLTTGSIDKILAEQLFAYLNKKENEEKETNEIRIKQTPVLIALFSIVPNAESAIEPEEKEMFPFWIKAVLDINGNLEPDEESFPYIPRVFLEPQLSERYFYTFSDVETIDRVFYDLKYDEIEWPEYWSYILGIFNRITGQHLVDYSVENYQTKYGFTLVVNDSLKGASDAIIQLYDTVLKSNSHSKLYERLVDENFPTTKRLCSIEDYEKDTQLHYGQMNYEFPLSYSQRNALYHFTHIDDGEIFALNGPPGTGKTTLLQSVVANEFVKKAIEGTQPGIIVATSTNNQAVVNIIDSFTKAKTKEGPLSGRWLPDLKSYGMYLPAKGKNVEEEISPDILYYKYTGEGFPSQVQKPEYVQKAKEFFLDKFKEYSHYREFTVAGAVDKLREDLLAIDKQLKNGIEQWKAYKSIFDTVETYSGKKDSTKYFSDSELNADLIKREKQILKEIEFNYLDYLNHEPWWKKLFVIFFKNERAANLFARFHDCPIEYQSVNFRKLKSINEFFRFKFHLIDNIQALHNTWNFWKNSNSIKSNPPLSFDELRRKEKRNQDYFYDELETGFKHQAFQLATHYWEGRWLMEMESLDEETLRRNNEAFALKKWQRFAMLTPCFVSTFYMIPKFFTFSRFVGNRSDGKPSFEAPPLIGGIDLLVVDEAGQVAPEVGAPSFALAQKAIVVGDVKQIEPVWNVPSKVDYSNLIRYGVINSEADKERIQKLHASGYLGSSGSIMKLAQKSCNYQLENHDERGFLLIEHRRCYNEIIQYCNALAYHNLLEPRRGKSNDAPFIPMSLVHVEGTSFIINKSRANREEALAISEWLAQNTDYILDYYGKAALKEYEKTDGLKSFKAPEIKDLVGIITPFTAQKYTITRMLKAKGIKVSGMKIGTVHALQGAERPIVLFSSVYSGNDIGKGYFFDRDNKPNMLNVAVSRAKDCFMVFGNRNIFAQNGSTPSSILAKHLKELNLN